jgi:hypothetical protein
LAEPGHFAVFVNGVKASPPQAGNLEADRVRADVDSGEDRHEPERATRKPMMDAHSSHEPRWQRNRKQTWMGRADCF